VARRKFHRESIVKRHADQMQLADPEVPTMPPVGTARGRVLQMLLDRAWVCGIQLSDEVGWAFGSRVVLYEYGIVPDERDSDG
jgi:hypothetical protein